MTRRKSATCACYLRLPSCRSPSARTRTGKLGRRFGTMSSAIYAYALDGQIVSAGMSNNGAFSCSDARGGGLSSRGVGSQRIKGAAIVGYARQETPAARITSELEATSLRF